AECDLVFGQGLTLSGHALVGDAPLKGAQILAQGTDVNHSGWGHTDGEGAFRIEGLVPGTYTVGLRQWESGISRDETVEVTASRDVTIRIPTARVVGRIVDSMDRRPIAGASVALALKGDTSARPAMGGYNATSDLDGKFQVPNVPDGAWTLTASRS